MIMNLIMKSMVMRVVVAEYKEWLNHDHSVLVIYVTFNERSPDMIIQEEGEAIDRMGLLGGLVDNYENAIRGGASIASRGTVT